MKGRSTFTKLEASEIRRLLTEKQTADRDTQKRVRGRLRTLGFYISDFSDDIQGFTASDFNRLVDRGTISISDEGEHPGSSMPTSNVSPSSTLHQEDVVNVGEPVLVDQLLKEILDAFSLAYEIDKADIPARPGLYAIFGDESVWHQLRLLNPDAARPLYVGKAEDSLVARDVKTHFGDGRTGSSTVRRSFAALLRGELGLVGIPRNLAKPSYFSNYGLSPQHDHVLTEWMRSHLRLAVWAKPVDLHLALREIELEVLKRLLPPLNLQGITTEWSAQLSAARAVMADEARNWTNS